MTTWQRKEGEWLRSAGYFAVLMCLMALFPLPMQSFYSVFRIIVTMAALWYSSAAYRQSNVLLFLLFAALAVFFNPVFLIEVPPLYWKPVALIAAILFLTVMARLSKIPLNHTDATATDDSIIPAA
jgi:predicted membrane protein